MRVAHVQQGKRPSAIVNGRSTRHLEAAGEIESERFHILFVDADDQPAFQSPSVLHKALAAAAADVARIDKKRFETRAVQADESAGHFIPLAKNPQLEIRQDGVSNDRQKRLNIGFGEEAMSHANRARPYLEEMAQIGRFRTSNVSHSNGRSVLNR